MQNHDYLSYYRCLAICKPLSSFGWRTTNRAKALIGLMYILAILYGSLYAYTTHFAGPRVCVAVGKKDKITRYLSWFMLVVNSIFPFVSILVINIMIVRTIHKRPDSKLDMDHDFKSEISECVSNIPSSTTDHSQIEDNSSDAISVEKNIHSVSFVIQRSSKSASIHRSKRKGDGGQLAFMLLTVSFAFLILTLPLSVRSVVYALGFFSADTNKEHAQAALVVAITSRLLLLNSAINFWLYSIAGRKFRQDLQNIFVNCIKCVRK